MEEQKPDWLLSSITGEKPQRLGDLFQNNLRPSDFDLKDKAEYKKLDKIKQITAFHKSKDDTTFDDKKFDDYYDQHLKEYNKFSKMDFDPFDTGGFKGFETHFNKMNRIQTLKNPTVLMNLSKQDKANVKLGKNKGFIGINQWSKGTEDERKLAIDNYVFDPTGKKQLTKDKVKDQGFIETWLNPKVYAKEKDGSYKINENGDFYTYYIDDKEGRNKEFVSAFDTGVLGDTYMSGIGKNKSLLGSIAKTATMIAPTFIPYVGQVYFGLGVAKSLFDSTPELGKMGLEAVSSVKSTYDDVNDWAINGKKAKSKGYTEEDWYKSMNSKLNYFQNRSSSLNTSVSRNSQEQLFTVENALNLLGDVYLQLGQQKLISSIPIYYKGIEKSLLSGLKGGLTNAPMTPLEIKNISNTAKTFSQVYNVGLGMSEAHKAAKSSELSDGEAVAFTALTGWALKKLYKSDIAQDVIKNMGLDAQSAIMKDVVKEVVGEGALKTGQTIQQKSWFANKIGSLFTDRVKSAKVGSNTVEEMGKKVTKPFVDIYDKVTNRATKGYDNVKLRTLDLTASGLSEALEEGAEAVIPQVFKMGYNALVDLGLPTLYKDKQKDEKGKELPYKKFDTDPTHFMQELGMSMVAGAAGGVMAKRLFDWKALPQNAKTQLVDYLGDSKAQDDFMDYVDSEAREGKLFDKNLSFDVEKLDKDNKQVIFKKAGKYEDSQAAMIAKEMRNWFKTMSSAKSSIENQFVQREYSKQQTELFEKKNGLTKQYFDLQKDYKKQSETEPTTAEETKKQLDSLANQIKEIDNDSVALKNRYETQGVPKNIVESAQKAFKEHFHSFISPDYTTFKSDLAELHTKLMGLASNDGTEGSIDSGANKEAIDAVLRKKRDIETGKLATDYLHQALFNINPDIHRHFTEDGSKIDASKFESSKEEITKAKLAFKKYKEASLNPIKNYDVSRDVLENDKKVSLLDNKLRNELYTNYVIETEDEDDYGNIYSVNKFTDSFKDKVFQKSFIKEFIDSTVIKAGTKISNKKFTDIIKSLNENIYSDDETEDTDFKNLFKETLLEHIEIEPEVDFSKFYFDNDNSLNNAGSTGNKIIKQFNSDIEEFGLTSETVNVTTELSKLQSTIDKQRALMSAMEFIIPMVNVWKRDSENPYLNEFKKEPLQQELIRSYKNDVPELNKTLSENLLSKYNQLAKNFENLQTLLIDKGLSLSGEVASQYTDITQELEKEFEILQKIDSNNVAAFQNSDKGTLKLYSVAEINNIINLLENSNKLLLFINGIKKEVELNGSYDSKLKEIQKDSKEQQFFTAFDKEYLKTRIILENNERVVKFLTERKNFNENNKDNLFIKKSITVVKKDTAVLHSTINLISGIDSEIQNQLGDKYSPDKEFDKISSETIVEDIVYLSELETALYSWYQTQEKEVKELIDEALINYQNNEREALERGVELKDNGHVDLYTTSVNKVIKINPGDNLATKSGIYNSVTTSQNLSSLRENTTGIFKSSSEFTISEDLLEEQKYNLAAKYHYISEVLNFPSNNSRKLYFETISILLEKENVNAPIGIQEKVILEAYKFYLAKDNKQFDILASKVLKLKEYFDKDLTEDILIEPEFQSLVRQFGLSSNINLFFNGDKIDFEKSTYYSKTSDKDVTDLTLKEVLLGKDKEVYKQEILAYLDIYNPIKNQIFIDGTFGTGKTSMIMSYLLTLINKNSTKKTLLLSNNIIQQGNFDSMLSTFDLKDKVDKVDKLGDLGIAKFENLVNKPFGILNALLQQFGLTEKEAFDLINGETTDYKVFLKDGNIEKFKVFAETYNSIFYDEATNIPKNVIYFLEELQNAANLENRLPIFYTGDSKQIQNISHTSEPDKYPVYTNNSITSIPFITRTLPLTDSLRIGYKANIDFLATLNIGLKALENNITTLDSRFDNASIDIIAILGSLNLKDKISYNDEDYSGIKVSVIADDGFGQFVNGEKEKYKEAATKEKELFEKAKESNVAIKPFKRIGKEIDTSEIMVIGEEVVDDILTYTNSQAQGSEKEVVFLDIVSIYDNIKEAYNKSTKDEIVNDKFIGTNFDQKLYHLDILTKLITAVSRGKRRVNIVVRNKHKNILKHLGLQEAEEKTPNKELGGYQVTFLSNEEVKSKAKANYKKQVEELKVRLVPVEGVENVEVRKEPTSDSGASKSTKVKTSNKPKPAATTKKEAEIKSSITNKPVKKEFSTDDLDIIIQTQESLEEEPTDYDINTDLLGFVKEEVSFTSTELGRKVKADEEENFNLAAIEEIANSTRSVRVDVSSKTDKTDILKKISELSSNILYLSPNNAGLELYTKADISGSMTITTSFSEYLDENGKKVIKEGVPRPIDKKYDYIVIVESEYISNSDIGNLIEPGRKFILLYDKDTIDIPEPEKSKVFKNKEVRIDEFKTKIIKLADYNNLSRIFETDTKTKKIESNFDSETNSGVAVIKEEEVFLETFIKDFKANLTSTRIITSTIKRAEELNKRVRTKLGRKKELEKGDLIVTTTSIKQYIDRQYTEIIKLGTFFTVDKISDGILEGDLEFFKDRKEIKLDSKKFTGYTVTLEQGGRTITIPFLDSNGRNELKNLLESKSISDYHSSIKARFNQIDLGYVTTLQKAQSKSYRNAYIALNKDDLTLSTSRPLYTMLLKATDKIVFQSNDLTTTPDLANTDFSKQEQREYYSIPSILDKANAEEFIRDYYKNVVEEESKKDPIKEDEGSDKTPQEITEKIKADFKKAVISNKENLNLNELFAEGTDTTTIELLYNKLKESYLWSILSTNNPIKDIVEKLETLKQSKLKGTLNNIEYKNLTKELEAQLDPLRIAQLKEIFPTLTKADFEIKLTPKIIIKIEQAKTYADASDLNLNKEDKEFLKNRYKDKIVDKVIQFTIDGKTVTQIPNVDKQKLATPNLEDKGYKESVDNLLKSFTSNTHGIIKTGTYYKVVVFKSVTEKLPKQTITIIPIPGEDLKKIENDLLEDNLNGNLVNLDNDSKLYNAARFYIWHIPLSDVTRLKQFLEITDKLNDSEQQRIISFIQSLKNYYTGKIDVGALQEKVKAFPDTFKVKRKLKILIDSIVRKPFTVKLVGKKFNPSTDASVNSRSTELNDLDEGNITYEWRVVVEDLEISLGGIYNNNKYGEYVTNEIKNQFFDTTNNFGKKVSESDNEVVIGTISKKDVAELKETLKIKNGRFTRKENEATTLKQLQERTEFLISGAYVWYDKPETSKDVRDRLSKKGQNFDLKTGRPFILTTLGNQVIESSGKPVTVTDKADLIKKFFAGYKGITVIYADEGKTTFNTIYDNFQAIVTEDPTNKKDFGVKVDLIITPNLKENLSKGFKQILTKFLGKKLDFKYNLELVSTTDPENITETDILKAIGEYLGESKNTSQEDIDDYQQGMSNPFADFFDSEPSAETLKDNLEKKLETLIKKLEGDGRNINPMDVRLILSAYHFLQLNAAGKQNLYSNFFKIKELVDLDKSLLSSLHTALIGTEQFKNGIFGITPGKNLTKLVDSTQPGPHYGILTDTSHITFKEGPDYGFFDLSLEDVSKLKQDMKIKESEDTVEKEKQEKIAIIRKGYADNVLGIPTNSDITNLLDGKTLKNEAKEIFFKLKGKEFIVLNIREGANELFKARLDKGYNLDFIPDSVIYDSTNRLYTYQTEIEKDEKRYKLVLSNTIDSILKKELPIVQETEIIESTPTTPKQDFSKFYYSFIQEVSKANSLIEKPSDAQSAILNGNWSQFNIAMAQLKDTNSDAVRMIYGETNFDDINKRLLKEEYPLFEFLDKINNQVENGLSAAYEGISKPTLGDLSDARSFFLRNLIDEDFENLNISFQKIYNNTNISCK
jgi:hypothetical protein